MYQVLKRLEFRGEVQRGYFVAGLAGAQFALPEAVEMLRAPPPDAPEPPVVMATTDPANVYSLPLQGVNVDSITRPRGSGALLVTIGGVVVLSAEGRGRRITIRPETGAEARQAAIEALLKHLMSSHGAGRRHDVVVETIDGESAGSSRWAALLLDVGFRREGRNLRYYAAIR
jgi:ATP-dependent Lhr-like helicase